MAGWWPAGGSLSANIAELPAKANRIFMLSYSSDITIF